MKISDNVESYAIEVEEVENKGVACELDKNKIRKYDGRAGHTVQEMRNRPKIFSKAMRSENWRNKEEITLRESDPIRGRDSQEKEQIQTGSLIGKEEETIPDEGKREPLDGNESRPSPTTRELASCLSRGELNGRSPNLREKFVTNQDRIHSPTLPYEDPKNHPREKKLIKLAHPKPFKGDGKSYLRCSPLAAKVRLGSVDGQTEKALVDVCSNTGIINKVTFEKYFSGIKLHPLVNEIKGVGRKKTVGWAVVPIFIDCTEGENQYTVEFDIEVYVVEHFSVPLLIGLDALMDYSIEISTSLQAGSITAEGENFVFPLFSNSNKYQNCVVKSSERVIIPGRCAKAIRVKSPAMSKGIDYLFSPTLTAPRSLPPSPQLAYGLMDADTKYIMFTNFSEHPVQLDKGQRLGEASAILFGSQYMDNLNLEIDWSDLTRPGPNRSLEASLDESGAIPPQTFSATMFDISTHYEDMLSFDAMGRERERPPRTISEDDVIRISKNARQRITGDVFPAEDDDEQTPMPPIPDGEVFEGVNVASSLSEEQKQDIINLVKTYPECFSKGDEIGHITTARATIKLSGPLPPAQPNRPVGPAKRAVIDESIDKLLEWDIIELSSSSTASPIVLVFQNNKWRFCVDFRALNKVTEGDAYPMLRSDYVFAALADKKFFSLLDAIKGYHQLEVDEKDRHKTAFISHRGLYQYKRMPFGLKNAPAQFQRMMDAVLGSLRWVAALVYIDDVLIYSSTWESHVAHLQTMLRSARRAGLKFSLEKCRFGFGELKLLGHGLSRYGLSTLDEKIKSIKELSIPKTVGELHRLVGMFGYYRNFIRNFSKIAGPLNELKRKPPQQGSDGSAQGAGYNSKAPIVWNKEAQSSFDELKARLCSAPVLAHPKFDGRPFILYTDASAEAFGAVLCQIWTAEDYDDPEDDEMGAPNTLTAVQNEKSWKDEYLSDPAFRKIYRELQKGNEGKIDNQIKKFSIHHDGSLRYQTVKGERICLPLTRVREVLVTSHDVLGHFGIEKTYDRISNTYYRPGLSTNVINYVHHCPNCIKNKTAKRKMEGSLMPIDMPDGSRTPEAFESINMDLIVGLPKSDGYDAILTIVDRFTRTGIFAPTSSNFTAATIADIFLEKVVARGFLPVKFITDRDPRLIQSFWQTMCARLKIDHRKTAAFHAQTDGAAERMNQTLEMALRAYVAPRQNDWSKHLPIMELAYNTAKSSTTGFSPYELLYAQPQKIVERIIDAHIPDIDDINENYAASDLLEATSVRIKDAQTAIVRATEAYKKQYDGRHRPVHEYKVGDYASIRLDRHPVSIIKLNKLSQQKLPPYRIKRVIAGGRAVELEIPESIGMHPVVSVQHIEHAPSPREDPFQRTPDTLKHKSIKSTKPDSTNSQIIDHRSTKGGKLKYKIRWNDQSADTDEWAISTKVERDLAEEYHDSVAARQVHLTNLVMETSPMHKVEHKFPTVIPKPGQPIERPILYISRVTKSYEKNYGATELELSCANWAITRLRHYLEGSKLQLISDHQPLGEVLNSAPGTQYSLRIDKWRMLLMPFLDDLTVMYKPGKLMTNVDPLSRAKYDQEKVQEGPLMEKAVFSNGGTGAKKAWRR